MLVVARADRLAQVCAIATRWELEATAIGRVTGDGLYRVRHGGRVVAEIPGTPLVDHCPVYQPDAVESAEARARRAAAPTGPTPPPEEALRRLLDTPGIASKRWVYEQYDSTVQASTVLGPGGGAGVVQVGDEPFGLVLATDGNGRHVLLDPYEGGKGAVVEAARNVAATGGRPIGITNCLNFGSPERPDIYFQFREACRGIADACRALAIPVTGGNVSFYNESPAGAVDPTPVIGMVGLIEDVHRTVRPWFAASGDAVFLLGRTSGHLGGSAYWAHVLEAVAGAPPPVDLRTAARLVEALVELAATGWCASVHDLSDGGIAVALAEACIGGPYARAGLGARIDLSGLRGTLGVDALLFGEDHSRALLSLPQDRAPDLVALADRHQVPVARIGTVGAAGGRLEIALGDGTLTFPVGELSDLYGGALPRRMETMATRQAA